MYALSRAAGRGARHLVAARAGMGGAVMTPTTIELFAGIGGFCSPHTHALALVEKENAGFDFAYYRDAAPCYADTIPPHSSLTTCERRAATTCRGRISSSSAFPVRI